MTVGATDSGDRATLLWLPVGAGGQVVKRTSAWWERACSRIERRRPAPLFHAALELHLGGVPFVVEMTPAWGVPAGDRGVVVTGPVGTRRLGRLRLFRYEVRCWARGVIPDREWAVGDPVVITQDTEIVARMARAVGSLPALTWGRTPPGAGAMWTSNSIVSWLLRHSGLPTRHSPPNGGRAPGWAAGEQLGHEDASRATGGECGTEPVVPRSTDITSR
ncbi:hypothetical protein [Polymorphospora rubra]|uniref:Uncharacterized protein n=1 Tax=Polymorphospora rubra TaxID=338584 RepID=A0A810NBQ9_9ACTN|nr:hypothetical protein [Polymorphospora rubra]BCJ69278.1 hypothetical protein Prubr_62990 [Polymorphospora rubra]